MCLGDLEAILKMMQSKQAKVNLYVCIDSRAAEWKFVCLVVIELQHHQNVGQSDSMFKYILHKFISS